MAPTVPVNLLPLDKEFVEAVMAHLRSDPSDRDALVALGLLFLSRGEPTKALEFFNRVTMADPKYPGIWRFKARAFDALGDTNAAKQCRLRGSDPHS